MKKTLAKVLATVLVASMLLTSCGKSTPDSTSDGDQTSGQQTSSESKDPFGKYDPAITIKTIRKIDPTRTYMEGESWENNIWTKAFEEELGIKFEYIWTCAANEYDSKINMAIASEDLPEMMVVPYSVFSKLAKNDQLEDMTQAFQDYASDQFKKDMNELNQMAIKQTTINGKMYGLGRALPPDTGLLYYRNDWAKNVGITEQPKTIDDVIEMAYKFVKENPNKDGSKTVGFGMDKSFWGGGFHINSLFGAYGASPKIWIEENGKVIYGGVSEKCKDVLKKMQQWYKDGLIDPDFVNKGEWAEAPDDVVKGKIGMAFAAVWFSDWQTHEVLKNCGDDATWTAIPVPDQDGNVAKEGSKMIQTNVFCATKGMKHPEALVKLHNLAQKYLQSAEGEKVSSDFHSVTDDKGQIINNFFHVVDFIGEVGGNPFWNAEIARRVTAALDSGDASGLNPEATGYYTRAKDYLDNKNPDGYKPYLTFGPNSPQVTYETICKDGNYTADLYDTSNTDTMDDKMTAIQSKQTEIYTRIVMGGDLEKEWKTWVDFYNAQGGPKMAQEVTDYVASK